jgi:magnesium-transporting ATPase (P-type)
MLTVQQLATFNDDQEVDLNRQALAAFGGIKGLESRLKTDHLNGLSATDLTDLSNRRAVYGRNEFPEPDRQSWLGMFLESFEDTTLIVLIVAAVVSLAVGLWEDPVSGWIEGAAILFAVLLVAVVTATNNYRKESQFRTLNAVKDDITVGVVRSGVSVNIGVKELVVGDVVRLNAGDRVPCDGVLVDGSDVTCNESALTGESDDKKKGPGGDVFMLSGAAVSTGFARVLATAVGEQSRSVSHLRSSEVAS